MSSDKPSQSKAAALSYDGENAPTIVAKGTDAVAREIIAIAEKHQVHIHNDPILIEVLSRLELGDEIPKELYLAVAKIIAFAYYLQGKHPDNKHRNAEINSVELLENSQNSLSHYLQSEKPEDC